MMEKEHAMQPNRMLWLLALGLLCATLPARGAVAGFPDVDDSSFTEANGDRTLQLSIVVPVSAKDAFAAFATTDGWKTWAVPFAVGEPRVGAVMETAYRLDAKLGDRRNIKNQFIAWLPERLLVFRNVQAPPDLPNADLFARVVSVVEFVPLGPTSTRIVMSGVGYGPEPGFDELYKMFQGGNAWSLTKLKQRFETGPVDWMVQLAPKLHPAK
jgi:uncharacterized protein YndB with AHSA1/START domain